MNFCRFCKYRPSFHYGLWFDVDRDRAFDQKLYRIKHTRIVACGLRREWACVFSSYIDGWTLDCKFGTGNGVLRAHAFSFDYSISLEYLCLEIWARAAVGRMSLEKEAVQKLRARMGCSSCPKNRSLYVPSRSKLVSWGNPQPAAQWQRRSSHVIQTHVQCW